MDNLKTFGAIMLPKQTSIIYYAQKTTFFCFIHQIYSSDWNHRGTIFRRKICPCNMFHTFYGLHH